MKHKKKICLLLALVLGTTPILTNVNQTKVYAQEMNKEVDKKYKKIVSVEQNGKTYNVEVFSDTPFIQTRSFSPEYPIGTIKNLSFRISKEMLGLGSGATEISIRELSKITAPLISKVITGAGYLSIAMFAGAVTMTSLGINGVEVNIRLKYNEHYYHKDGYSVYLWKIDNVSFSKY